MINIQKQEDMFPQRLQGMTSFIVMDVLEKAKQMEKLGARVIHLEVGEPDFNVPPCVEEAVCKAVRDGHTHYTHSLGIIELRESICAYYQQRYNVNMHPDQVIVCQGTSPAMLNLFATLLDPGDEVIMSDPHYACYPNFITFLGGICRKVTLAEDDGFQLHPQLIRQQINNRTKAVLINSPANPTGTVIPADRMKAIAGLGPWIVSDEIYHGLAYGEQEHSILEYTDHAFVLNGFSKMYAMTGLRLGYTIVPEAFIRPFQILQQNFFIAANSISQIAGIAALQQAAADVERMRETYNQRRKFMIQRLREIGFHIPVEPTGAFYVFANARHFSADSYRLAFDILDKAHVAVTPGIDFGAGGEGFIRFSYANSMENIAEGMDRLEKYVQSAQWQMLGRRC